jgi:hypothetical protein
MEAMRFVEHPKDGKITIELPNSLKTKKKLEIIVLPYVPYEEKERKKKSFDPRKFRGAAKLNMTPEEINCQCAELRDEWERNI